MSTVLPLHLKRFLILLTSTLNVTDEDAATMYEDLIGAIFLG
jgi:hypothetical protein